jgi:hypothetical protein
MESLDAKAEAAWRACATAATPSLSVRRSLSFPSGLNLISLKILQVGAWGNNDKDLKGVS